MSIGKIEPEGRGILLFAIEVYNYINLAHIKSHHCRAVHCLLQCKSLQSKHEYGRQTQNLNMYFIK